MKAFVDLEEYRKSIYKLFGRFPILFLVLSCVGAYMIGIIMTNLGSEGMDDPIGLEGLSNAFFRGVLVTVGLYYIGRISAESAIKKSHGLTDREPTGFFIPCMSHKNMMDLSYGNIVVTKDRMYFEPNRPFGGDLTFDYIDYRGFTFGLSKPKESAGLFLITGENYMLTVNDANKNRVAKFIITQPEHYLPVIQQLLLEEGSEAAVTED